MRSRGTSGSHVARSPSTKRRLAGAGSEPAARSISAELSTPHTTASGQRSASVRVSAPGPQPRSAARRTPPSGRRATRSKNGCARSRSKRAYCAGSQPGFSEPEGFTTDDPEGFADDPEAFAADPTGFASSRADAIAAALAEPPAGRYSARPDEDPDEADPPSRAPRVLVRSVREAVRLAPRRARRRRARALAPREDRARAPARRDRPKP